ncbi:trafficking protein particle complex subunit 4-like [Saccoglossus kowalevskii]|uniref:Trafficking protein particle complex subunit n=1 Tax=Saccoglossus kowalevskii TaxID=10224 RepID=A0ABM0GYG2_SACKO|nr:PREDICTED: trafficking protein particle complex subunit 4-like [Saccoglossus kowalevskii]
MAIFAVYVVNRAGGLIYQMDHTSAKTEVEKTFSYPLELVLKIVDERVVVSFGQRDGIKVGHTLLAINGETVTGRGLEDGRDVLDVIADSENYPIAIKFGRPKLSSNERIMLASMFHSLFVISCQLSPDVRSSGIEVLEVDTFKLHCFQTLTGIKFIVLTDPRQGGVESLLKKIYEIYSDFALKNPFYSLDMPIRCELFESNILSALEQSERAGMYTASV